MRELVFDIETTPIDKEDRRKLPKTIHCLVIGDAATGEITEYGPGQVDEGVKVLKTARRLIGHDIARFDLPVIEGVYGDRWDWHGEIFDTHNVSRLVYASNMKDRSLAFRASGGKDIADPEAKAAAIEAKLPGKLVTAHKLEAWGYRLGIAKQHADVDVDTFFAKWTPELQERCASDVKINVALYRHLLAKSADPQNGWPLCSLDSMLNESRVAYIVGQQERNGVGFDRGSAIELLGVLQEQRELLEKRLRAQVRPWLVPSGPPVTPKRDRTMRKNRKWPAYYTVGAEYQPVEWNEFLPGSALQRGMVLEGREERQRRLHKAHPVYGPVGYGWQAEETTKCGQAVTDEETLVGLPYEIIPDLLAYMTVAKRLGQLSDGNEAWLKHAKDGRIHGGVLPTGTRTSRAAHFKPNLGQVPKCSSLYGPECRAMFKPTRPGWVQVGVDAQGLELRMLAHYLYPYDNGAFAKVVLEADPHTLWMQGTGIYIRDNQKTWTYAFLYGAGDEKLGRIILEDWRMAVAKGLTDKPAPDQKEAKSRGKRSRSKLLRHFTALEHLLDECKKNHAKGWFTALDGRVLACPSEHGALNDLLQSAGAIVVKHAMPVWYRELVEVFGPHGKRWAQMLWVHDEHSCECEPEIAEELGAIIAASFEKAGVRLGVHCRMDGKAQIGKNWSECH